MDREKLSNVMYLTSAYKPDENASHCHICLCEGPLTREHVPPRSAFNNRNALWERLVVPEGHSESARQIKFRGGFWIRSLCQDCNNRICAPYAKAYVDFVHHLVGSPKLFDATGRARLVPVPCDTLMLAKQIAAMILAVEPLKFAQHNSELRRFVLNERLTFQPQFRIYVFLVPDVPHAGTVTRFHARADTFAPGYAFSGGEISSFPFGFLYASQIGCGYDPQTLTDVTRWFTTADPRDRVRDCIPLFCRVTGVESIQCGVGRPRVRPQIDYVA